MRSILEEFFYGNVHPQPQSFKRDSEYGEALRLMSCTEEKLLARLNEEEQEIFFKYIAAQGEANHLATVSTLIHGYKLGVLTTAEAFVTGSELIAR